MSERVEELIQGLRQTPAVLRAIYGGIEARRLHQNEGPDTFTPMQVLQHLIQGEQQDWIERTRIILKKGEAQPFKPFDQKGALNADANPQLDALLDEFSDLRAGNLETLRSFEIDEMKLSLRGTHNALGPVTLRQLLHTWYLHDLGHIAQICRVVAKGYRDDVGPWQAYLPVLRDRT